jgi:hypothetical protein
MVITKKAGDDSLEQQKVYRIHLELSRYPILARRIQELMRQELFAQDIISREKFEAEVREKAILSQYREGLTDPFGEEPANVWSERLAVIRDQLTNVYYANNFSLAQLRKIIQKVLSGRVTLQDRNLALTFNPELAPWDLLFAQGLEYEKLPTEKRAGVQHHLREIIVVLIKRMLSDQLDFVGVAKELFTIGDLMELRRRRIGRGKIGGKAAGMLLAHKILQLADSQDPLGVHEHVTIPDSYFIGADVSYDFSLINGFTGYMNQKYKSREEIEADYPRIRQAYAEGQFPGEIIYSLRKLLERVGTAPLVVRSSSLLEVHFGAALAGKYKSVFCPNQGTLEKNLTALMRAITDIYASIFSPDALFYRQRMGLVDYDERMAILIQKAQGTYYRDFFFPTVAGIGYSENPFRWDPKIEREEGFLRLVCGFGTRAVERVPNDYPRIVALSHPQIQPYVGPNERRKYAQRLMDVLDLKANALKTLPAREVLKYDYPTLRYVASLDKGDYMTPIVSLMDAAEHGRFVLTFDKLISDGHFIELMKAALARLERYYQTPVDMEFTVEVTPGYPHAEYTLHLLQCRPLVSKKWKKIIQIPDDIPDADLILRATHLVPQGIVKGVRYIVYVDPEQYSQAPDYETKLEIARVIGRLNKALEGAAFILIGPGRWGSSDVDLGVKVTYADIFNTKVLAEVPLARWGSTSEPSYGTHFFQDLIEAGIFPLPIIPDDGEAMLNTNFLHAAPNVLPEILPGDAACAPYIRVIDVPATAGSKRLEIVMNGDQERAVGYLKAPEA